MVEDHQVNPSKATHRDVEETLAAVLRSGAFNGSAQLSDFLTFIVRKTLANQHEDIKAYSIAVDALGRSEDFDPQTNAAVRVAAGRLRQALSAYNASEESAENPVRIELASGSYVPVFVVNESETKTLSSQGEPTGKLDEIAPLPSLAKTPLAPNLQGEIANTKTPAKPARTPIAVGLVVTGLIVALAAVLSTIRSLDYADNPPIAKPASSTKVAGSSAGTDINAQEVMLRPTVFATLALPDDEYPDWLKLGELRDAINVAIARFEDYKFLGTTIVRKENAQPARTADYQIQLTAHRREDEVRFYGSLTRAVDGEVLWTVQRAISRPASLTDRKIVDMISREASPLFSPYGIIYADIAKGMLNRPATTCFVKTYQYFYSKTDAKHAEARECSEKLIKDGMATSGIHSALTFLHLDTYREDRNPRAGQQPLLAAANHANIALRLAPLSARAHQARFAVFKVQGDRARARASAERALQLNPYDSDIIADFGAWKISIGEVSGGRALFKRVDEELISRPAWLMFYKFLAAELEGDRAQVARLSRLMDVKRSPLTAMAVAIGAHQSGRKDDVKKAWNELKTNAPKIVADPMSNLLKRGFAPEVAQKLIDRFMETDMKSGS